MQKVIDIIIWNAKVDLDFYFRYDEAELDYSNGTGLQGGVTCTKAKILMHSPYNEKSLNLYPILENWQQDNFEERAFKEDNGLVEDELHFMNCILNYEIAGNNIAFESIIYEGQDLLPFLTSDVLEGIIYEEFELGIELFPAHENLQALTNIEVSKSFILPTTYNKNIA